MASTTSVAASVAPAAPDPVGAIRVGVVGAGYWGPKLIRNFAALPEAWLTSVCDIDPARLRALAPTYPDATFTTDYERLLASDVEAVAIATPVHTHYALVREALLAGKHVLVEKPLTTSAAEAAELVALAAQRGRVLLVGHTFLFEPAVEALRDLVRDGALGEVWHVTMRRLNLGLFRPDVNVLWDLAPHDLSILLEVLGALPVAVSARGASYVQPSIEDVVYLELRFPNDILAHVHASWLDPGKVRRMTVVGSQRMAVYDDTEACKLALYDRAARPLPGAEDQVLYQFGDRTPVPLPTAEPLRRQCAYFLACVRGMPPMRAPGLYGLPVVRILEEAQHSLEDSGRRRELHWTAAERAGAFAAPAAAYT